MIGCFCNLSGRSASKHGNGKVKDAYSLVQ